MSEWNFALMYEISFTQLGIILFCLWEAMLLTSVATALARGPLILVYFLTFIPVLPCIMQSFLYFDKGWDTKNIFLVTEGIGGYTFVALALFSAVIYGVTYRPLKRNC